MPESGVNTSAPDISTPSPTDADLVDQLNVQNDYIVDDLDGSD